MIEKTKKRFAENDKNKEIVEKVFNNPYIELNDVLSKVEEDQKETYKSLLEQLTNDLILIELTSQAGSSIESRVPKRLLIVNPEIEADLEEILS